MLYPSLHHPQHGPQGHRDGRQCGHSGGRVARSPAGAFGALYAHETVIVAGKIRKWKGQLLNVNLTSLYQQLLASRDYIFNAAGIKQDLFGPQ